MVISGVSVDKNAKAIKEALRELIPDVPVVRKTITKRRINKYQSVLLPEEAVLCGENNDAEKHRIVEVCRGKWPEVYSKTQKAVDNYLNTGPQRYLDDGQQEMLRTDMLFCRFAYGFVVSEYLLYDLGHKNIEQRKSYISETDHICFSYRMNDFLKWQVFNDKIKTYQYFRPYYHRDIISIQQKADFDAFQAFVDAHPIFVKKNVYESCGKSVEKIDFPNCGKTLKELFEELIQNGKTILEELLLQSEETRAFNDSSVNTVRCITFNTKHGVITPYCFMKIGRAGSFVDNGGSGGILAGIDESTGTLNTNGIDELGHIYKVHPDSGIEFIGHQLPQWGKMIQVCKEMSSQITTVKYIGWDMAYTIDHDWCVVEGNGLSQFVGPQSTMQRGIKQEVERIMEEMELVI